jgi:methylenetetrahydrofolate reductase (NADPH)
LKPETDAESIRNQADVLRDHVDGVILTDNHYGQMHMSTVAAGRLMLDNGVDPVVQLSCRNRNRTVLIADILGAAALGITSLLLVRGNRVPEGKGPRSKAVLDMSVAELIATASELKENELLRSIPDLFIGGSLAPHAPEPNWVPQKPKEKADAGAQFLLAHTNMDIELLRDFMKHLIAARLTRQASIIVSTAILTSADDAIWLRKNRRNFAIPDSVVKRLETADDPRQEGIAICAEHLALLAATPGVSGANVIASTELALIPEAIRNAKLR